MNTKESIRLDFKRMTTEEQHNKLNQFLSGLKPYRNIKSFSAKSLSNDVLTKAIHTAGTSPSGANQQPWTFVTIKNYEVKKEIRRTIESERPNEQLNTEILEEAPYLVALFKQKYGVETKSDGTTRKIKHYYASESTGICAGFFVTALHQLQIDYQLFGPIKPLNQLLNRPENEEHFLLFAVGFADQFEESNQHHKALDDVVIFQGENIDEKLNSDDQLSVTSDKEHLKLADQLYSYMKKRRNVRDFSTERFDIELVKKSFQSLKSSPFLDGNDSFRFVVVEEQKDKELIREKAEEKEKEFYEEKISNEWQNALKPLGTDWQKPHLSDAPLLIIANKVTNQAVQEIDKNLLSPKSRQMISASLNTGILMSTIHHAGLCMLTHTPSPMNFIRDLLDRPTNEMPIVIIPVGFPTHGCEVPKITKKPIDEILVEIP